MKNIPWSKNDYERTGLVKCPYCGGFAHARNYESHSCVKERRMDEIKDSLRRKVEEIFKESLHAEA